MVRHAEKVNFAQMIRKLISITAAMLCALLLQAGGWQGRCLHLDIGNGLTGNNVQALAEDGRGRMWIATDVGLVRYDGISCVPFLDGHGPEGRMNVQGLAYSAGEDAVYAGDCFGKIVRIDCGGEAAAVCAHGTAVSLPAGLRLAPVRSHVPDTVLAFLKLHRVKPGDVSCSLYDRHHNLWVATRGFGLWMIPAGGSFFRIEYHDLAQGAPGSARRCPARPRPAARTLSDAFGRHIPTGACV